MQEQRVCRELKVSHRSLRGYRIPKLLRCEMPDKTTSAYIGQFASFNERPAARVMGCL